MKSGGLPFLNAFWGYKGADPGENNWQQAEAKNRVPPQKGGTACNHKLLAFVTEQRVVTLDLFRQREHAQYSTKHLADQFLIAHVMFEKHHHHGFEP